MTKRVIATLLACAAVVAAPAAARDPKPAAKGAKSGKAAKQAANAQNLVSVGKRPAFYVPSDLTQAPVVSAPSSLLMDADTGQILWEKNADVRRFPASTTKIMTGLLLAENTQPGDVITCTDKNIRQIEESSLHIQPWEKFTSKDLLTGFMLRSGNDGAVVIAQHISGTVPQFADLMNQRARELGAVNTNFRNPNGLPDPNHYTTARDLALIAAAAMKNPRFAEAVRVPKRTIARSKVVRDTVIVAKVKKYFYDKFPGADGVKTGYTRAARHCFVGSATRDGRRLLSVTLGASNSASGDSIPLLSWGFARFPQVVVARKNQPGPDIAVRGGVIADVPTTAAGNLHATIDRFTPGAEAAVTTQATPLPNVSAPVRKGQTIGTLTVTKDNKPMGSVALLAAEDVAASPIQAATVTVAQNGARTVLWGGAGAVLVGLGYGTAATAKSARRRRRRLAARGGGVDSGG